MSAVGAGGQSSRSAGFLDGSGLSGGGIVKGDSEGEHVLAGGAVNAAVEAAEAGGHGASGDEVSFEHEGAEQHNSDHERHGKIDRGSAGSDGGVGWLGHGAVRITKIRFRGYCGFWGEKGVKTRVLGVCRGAESGVS